jgi:hypothetical protein
MNLCLGISLTLWLGLVQALGLEGDCWSGPGVALRGRVGIGDGFGVGAEGWDGVWGGQMDLGDVEWRLAA